MRNAVCLYLVIFFMVPYQMVPSEDTITITISKEDSMKNDNSKCEDTHVGGYDPTEHDEPHEKRIDKVLSIVGKVVKSGFGLFLVVKGAAKIFKSIFRR